VGRIVSSVTITNIADAAKSLRCDALVDTGASFMVLPSAWKDRLGELETIEEISLETATQETITGEVCGPVRIQIEGFRPIFNEVLFIEMNPEDGIYEPLIGYIILEQSRAKDIKEMKVERPPRATVSEKEALKRMQEFPKRKKKFLAAVGAKS
jgi:predicted aspartyl protease